MNLFVSKKDMNFGAPRAVMDFMCVFPQNSYIKVLTNSHVVFGAFSR